MGEKIVRQDLRAGVEGGLSAMRRLDRVKEFYDVTPSLPHSHSSAV
jgi:hypothetical protein